MKLFFKKTGEGRPLIILHGLFGMSDNWATLAKGFAEEGFAVYQVDLRNHGRSPHSDEFSYESMAEDIFELMNEEGIEQADFIGHSMGGKVLMFFSEKYSGKIEKMIIADIAPRYYSPHHQTILAALHAIETETLDSRKQAEEQLRSAIQDEGTIQFLLKNLYWREESKLDWRFYLKGIENNIEEIGKAFSPKNPIQVSVLFLKGGNSGYINEMDEQEIKRIYPQAEIKTIQGAGHWVHAENPKAFFEITIEKLKPENK